MNPILARYASVALVAVIFGVGGGYLAVKNKKASPPAVTQSGTIPAVPAEPTYPGAIPAIPAIPPASDKEPTTAVKISSVQPYSHIIWTRQQNDLAAGRVAQIFGEGFSPRKNTINWDGVPLFQNVDAFNDNTRLDFRVPEDAKPGDTHTLTVTTPRGTSNSVQVRIVEWMSKPSYMGIRLPASGPVGTKIEMSIIESNLYGATPYKYVSAEIYAVLPQIGTSGRAVIPTPLKPNQVGQAGGIYSVTIPDKVEDCSSFLSVDRQSECFGAPDTQKVELKAGMSTYVRLIAIYRFENSTHIIDLYPTNWFPESFSQFLTITGK